MNSPRSIWTTVRSVGCAVVLFCLMGYPPEGRPAQPSENSGWESEWERTIKAAEQEGEVSYYSLGDYGFLADFEKKFPRIKVKGDSKPRRAGAKKVFLASIRQWG